MDLYATCCLCMTKVRFVQDIPTADGLVGAELAVQQLHVAKAGMQFEPCGHIVHIACHNEAVEARCADSVRAETWAGGPSSTPC
jgi:hypothetical protein